MTKTTTSLLCKAAIAAGILATPLTGQAVPAYPGPVKHTQPDGTTVTIRLEGDENTHRVFSEDGYLLLPDNNGAYTYARLSADGKLEASAFKATEKNNRNAACRQFLASLNTTDILKASEKLSYENAERKLVAKKATTGFRKSEPMKGLGLVPSSFPPYGEPKGLVILVEYQDVRFSGTKDKPEEGEEPVFDAYDYFNRMLNEEGFSDYDGTGSARDWFIFNSNGLFMPHFDVYGPVTLPNKMKYYGGNDPYRNDRYPERMAIHACEILDETVDFSQYDTDGDGKIDNVFIFYAGLGEADGGGSDTVWPHSFDVSSATKKKYIFDGVQLDHYACSNEIDNQYNRPDGIGTFVHEFSHVLGLPDLYSTIYNDAFTPGDWSPLDSGPYNNQGRTPPNYSTFERYALGWMEPTEIKGLYSFTQQEDPENSDQREDPMQIPTRSDNSSDDSEEDPEEPNVTVECYTLPNLAEENVAFISWASDSEYFLFENRQKTGNDAYIPGHGMLVWHIDYNEEIWYYNQVNNTPSHQYVDLVEADNSKSTKSRSGDSFPGTKNKTSYGEETRPAFKTWSKEYMGFNLENIAESEDGIISFDVVRKVENGGTNGVGTSIASRDSWSVSGNVISCSGPTAVYDFSGRTVARLGAGESASLPSGLYIVRSSSRSGKILVK